MPNVTSKRGPYSCKSHNLWATLQAEKERRLTQRKKVSVKALKDDLEPIGFAGTVTPRYPYAGMCYGERQILWLIKHCCPPNYAFTHTLAADVYAQHKARGGRFAIRDEKDSVTRLRPPTSDDIRRLFADALKPLRLRGIVVRQTYGLYVRAR